MSYAKRNKATKNDGLAHIFESFFTDYRDTETGKPTYDKAIKLLVAEGKQSLIVDFKDLERYDSHIAREILSKPKITLEWGDIALKRRIAIDDPNYPDEIERIYLRITNLPSRATISLRDIRAKNFGKLIQVDGIVTRTTKVQPVLTIATFECKYCYTYQDIIQPDGLYTPPVKCLNQICGKTGSNAFKLSTMDSSCKNWQQITIQERPEDAPTGEMPRSFTATLFDDLVGGIRPGDRVTLVAMLNAKVPQLKPNQLAKLSWYLDVLSFEKSSEEYQLIEITEEDEKKIKEYSANPFVHEKISESIAPAIYGYEDEKEAISLLLFGGTGKELEDGTKIRGEINVLLIGDPGVGKTQILSFVDTLVPRSVLASGKGSTKAGLTAAVLRDPETQEFTIEAGVLVLADRGVAIIDEFDDMSEEDRSSLHEAMEQHRVSINKAGIHITLNARTSILAAANPKLGRWSPFLEPMKNLNLKPTILSRFDLIFPMLDEPNPVEDKKKIKHIAKLHETGSLPKTMPENLDFLRKYIAYARKNVHPKLSPDARDKLVSYYLELRAKSAQNPDSNSLAITPRQFEALVRLSEARAKQALRQEVREEDAAVAIKLMETAMRKIAMDPITGDIDIDRITLGKGAATQSKMSLVIQIFDQLVEQTASESISFRRISGEASKKGIDEKELVELMGMLLQEGQFYEANVGIYRKL